MSCSGGSLLVRLLVGWLLVVSLVSHVDGADGEPAPGDEPDHGGEVVHRDDEGDHRDDEGEEKPKRNWIEDNLVLFLVLVHGTWITLVVGGLLIAKAVVRRREEKRTNGLRAVAGELELTFLEDGDEALAERLSGLPLFDIGRGRTLKNLIVADTPDVQVALFDYVYITGRGKQKRVRRQTVAAVQSADLRLPDFHLRPERTLDAVGSLLGRQDIDFDDHPDFSKAFVLKSLSEQETRDFFDQGLLDFFVSRPDISFEAARGVFVYFRRWKRVEPQVAEMKGFLGEGYSVLQALRERLTRT